jgi:hypothetical protein
VVPTSKSDGAPPHANPIPANGGLEGAEEEHDDDHEGPVCPGCLAAWLASVLDVNSTAQPREG